MRIFLLIGLVLCTSTPSWAAAPVVTGVTGASIVDLTGIATIYGGFAGSAASCPTEADGVTCNNCTEARAAGTCDQTPLCPCNTNRAYDTKAITITVSTADAGEIIAAPVEATTVFGTLNSINSNTTIQFTWGQLCGALFESPTNSCDNITISGSKSLRLYLDKSPVNGQIDSGEEFVEVAFRVVKPESNTYDVFANPTSEGVGSFTPYPGDEKVYLEDVVTHTTFPDMGYGFKATAVRVFMSRTSIADAYPGKSDEPADLGVETDGSELLNSSIDGLENGVPYVFRVGVIDQANNLVQYYPGVNPDANCNSPTTFANCPFAATPDAVLGMLTDDFNCFVASAAYGTSLEPKLDVFRKFRFKILSRYSWGIEFVKKYYKYGPYAARYIHDKPAVQAVTRAALWPLYGFSTLALNIGLWPATVISLLTMILLLALPVYGLKRWQLRA